MTEQRTEQHADLRAALDRRNLMVAAAIQALAAEFYSNRPADQWEKELAEVAVSLADTVLAEMLK